MPHRVRQLIQASRLPGPSDYQLAGRLLTPALLDLFERQHPRDIVHSAATASWLLERGYDDRDLLAAALLHDVGKGGQRRRDRVAHVVLGWAKAGSLAASGESRFEMRRALQRTREHSATGAALLAGAGASMRTVELTRRHHESRPADPVLALLQRADAAS